MARFLLLKVVALALLAAVHAMAGGEVDLVGWSTSSKRDACAVAPQSKQSLVFVFDDFAAAHLAKAFGAYRETLADKCPECTLPITKRFFKTRSNACHTSFKGDLTGTVDGTDIKAVVAAAKTGAGRHVIDMHAKLNELNSMQDAVIHEALETAMIASNGELDVQFTGKASSDELSSANARTLQSVVPLTIRMAPDTFIGLTFLVLSHLLLIFFLCCCMDGIAIQTKYAKQYPLRGKELN